MPTLMFQERFAAKVIEGTKVQTIRPERKRPIVAGDRLSLRKWKGKPYRSKQVLLLEAKCSARLAIWMDESKQGGVVMIGMKVLEQWEKDEMAHADGFDSWATMFAWYKETHGMPFVGDVILWA